MAFDSIAEKIINSRKKLEVYDPLVLIEKLKSKDMKAWNLFFPYVDALMESYILKLLTPAHVNKYKDDWVQDFFIRMFGEKMRVDELHNKEKFLSWINWEVSYFVLDNRKKKKDPGDQTGEDFFDKPITSSDGNKEGWDGDDDDDEIEYTPELLQHLLSQINPTYATLIRMSVCDGLKVREIAKILGYTPRFVSDKKNKGMDSLVKKSQEYQKEFINRKHKNKIK